MSGNEIQISPNHRFWQQDNFIGTIKGATVLKYHLKHHQEEEEDAPKERVATYKTVNTLGKGNFGAVYAARVATTDYDLKTLTYTNTQKVVKVIRNVDQKTKKLILAEVTQAQKTPHLEMRDPVFKTNSVGEVTCYLVMNHLPGDELYKKLTDDSIARLSRPQKLELTYKLLIALREQVSRCGIVHRDLKPANILVVLEPEIQVNIIDYGFAKEQGTVDTNFAGSPAYVAPEIIQGDASHDTPCDVFSIARVAALICGQSFNDYDNSGRGGHFDPFKMKYNALNAAKRLDNNPFLKQEPQLKALLQDMLNPMPTNRPSIEDAIQRFEDVYPNLINPVDDRIPIEDTIPVDEIIAVGQRQIALSSQMGSKENLLAIQPANPDVSPQDEKIIAAILVHLQELETYAKSIQGDKPKDADTLTTFVDNMREILSSKRPTKDIKRQCTRLQQGPGIKKCAKNYQVVSFVLKNIAAALLGLGVFYAAACVGKGLATGQFLFFHDKISDTRHEIGRGLKAMAQGT